MAVAKAAETLDWIWAATLLAMLTMAVERAASIAMARTDSASIKLGRGASFVIVLFMVAKEM